MRKLIFCLCCLLLAVTGCNKSPEKYSEEKLALYASYYNAVLENTNFEEYSRYFNISSEVTQREDGTWLYYIFVDTPQIAMYDVEMIALEELIDYSEDQMMPSFGIFDDEEYSMLPYQVDAEKGFVKGIVVSGDIDDPTRPLYVMVSWKDMTRLNQSREFLEVHLADKEIDGVHEAEDDAEGDETDAEDADDEEAEG